MLTACWYDVLGMLTLLEVENIRSKDDKTEAATAASDHRGCEIVPRSSARPQCTG